MLSPMFVTFNNTPADINIRKNTILNDYSFIYPRYNATTQSIVNDNAVISFGNMMLINHSTKNYNVRYVTLPPPTKDSPNPMAIGFVAWRNIKAGEELFSNYNDAGASDHNNKWFETRGIDLMESDSNKHPTKIPDSQLEKAKSKYCSKIYTGMSYETYQKVIINSFPAKKSPFKLQRDALSSSIDTVDYYGYGNANS